MIDSSDGFQITQLFARYGHAVDECRWDEVIDCFTEDGVFDTLQMANKIYEGRAAIRAGFADYHRHSHAHFACDILLDQDGDAVTALSNWKAPREGLIAGGIYRDTIVRDRDGRWRFKRRVCEQRWIVPETQRSSVWIGE